MNTGDAKMPSRRRNANIAYGCYASIALVIVVSKTLEWALSNPQSSDEFATLQGVGMIVILPLSIAAIVAAIFGVESSFKLWSFWRHEPGLFALPLLLLILLGAFILTESSTLSGFWLALLAAVYVVAAGAFGWHWFFNARKRFL